MAITLFDRIVIPVASEKNGRATCEAALPHLQESKGKAYLAHVIEKAGGAPDKASVEQRELVAEDIFNVAREPFKETGFTDFETRLLYGTDVVQTILDTCTEVDATAVVFVTREASRWKRLLSGDVALKLITENPYPVIVLPAPDND